MIDKEDQRHNWCRSHQQGNEEAFLYRSFIATSQEFTQRFIWSWRIATWPKIYCRKLYQSHQHHQRWPYNEEGKFALDKSHCAQHGHWPLPERETLPGNCAGGRQQRVQLLKFSGNPIEIQEVGRDNKKWMRQCVRELPDEQKRVLIMRHYLDMSFQERLTAPGWALTQPYSRMRYALINLRKLMLKSQYA